MDHLFSYHLNFETSRTVITPYYSFIEEQYFYNHYFSYGDAEAAEWGRCGATPRGVPPGPHPRRHPSQLAPLVGGTGLPETVSAAANAQAPDRGRGE